MRRFFAATLFAAALVASIATSPPSWSVGGHDRDRFVTERGQGMVFDIVVSANAEALPEVEGGVAPPQGGGGEDGLVSGLTLEVELRTQGTLGIGREATAASLALWMASPEGDILVAEEDVEVDTESPVTLFLQADGVLGLCAPVEPCTSDLWLEIVQDGDARLRATVKATARVHAPLMGPAPKEAELLVEIEAGDL